MDQDRPVPNAMPRTEEGDPLVEECLRDALGPYLGALSPDEAADYREFLIVLMQTHPAMATLYQRLRERPATVETSSNVARAGAATEPLSVRADGTSGRDARPSGETSGRDARPSGETSGRDARPSGETSGGRGR